MFQLTVTGLASHHSRSGKNYIGEIVPSDGRVLVTRFVDKDAAVRYGNMVYIRCAPRA